MSGITSVQASQEVNNINPMQDLQKSSSLHGRDFHKITGGKYIIQSINNIAQLILSTCIRVVSFGRYNLDSLKSYLFSSQTALKQDDTAPSSNSPMRPAPLPPPNAPPPPPMPTSDELNRASFSTFSVKVQSSSFQEPITSRIGSADLRSSFNPAQNSPEESFNILGDSANSRSPSLHEGSDSIEGQGNNEPSASLQVKKKGIRKEIKQVIGGLFAGAQNNPLFQRKQRELNPEQSD